VVNPRSLTAAGARSLGVSHATGEWIAFLDDDDEWLPHKLERQMQVARGRANVLVTSLSGVITPIATYVWPRVIFDNTRPLGDYLFDRQGAFGGASFMQTSSYLMPRALYQSCPFRVDTPHDDWDFLLRLSEDFGARVETVPEVLVNVYVEEQRPSLSHTGSWAVSLAWLERVRPLLTQRAYSGFCLGVVGSRAASQHAYLAFFLLLFRAFRNGAPRHWHVLTFLASWIVPQNLRRHIRAGLARRRRSAAPDVASHATIL
jgi:glycosyltransferase involved in cell wall biosynthesis